MAGLVGCVFYLISECTCFWPQTDRVYLFLAANIKCQAKVMIVSGVVRHAFDAFRNSHSKTTNNTTK